MFNEDNTIEQMTISVLVENGWKYVPAEALPRSFSDVMVEPMVREALLRLNPVIAEEPSRADEVLHRLRKLISSVQPHDLVTQNEKFKKWVFEENAYPFGDGGRMTAIRFFGTAQGGDLDKNEYIVTNQWVYPCQEGGKRLDIVLLINGFPVSVGELKTPVRSAITWLDGAEDMADYEQSIPQMFVTNIFNFATEGKRYRYGAVCAPPDLWGPWHTALHKSEGRLADVKISMEHMLRPERVLDIFQFFTLFATDKKFRKYKIVCRYQQYEGANLLVARVAAGYPRRGLVWHFQGSGKSLLMIFAAQKLRMMPELKNPTVVIVDDRLDLETQITAAFNAADIPNLQTAGTRQELVDFFQSDMRKILITTIFKFGEVDCVLNRRDNIVVMVDEAHRTQEGGLGERMRLALPNAFFFGLTGTPINRGDRNTFTTFGAPEDPSGYMSRYSFSDSIRDKATLPLHFEPVPVELHIEKELLDAAARELTEGLTEDERAELSRRVDMKAVMYAPDRERKVCEHIVGHYRARIEPNGYKGQVVCYDKECCRLYKEELDRLMGPEASAVVIDTNGDKANRYKAFRRSREEEAQLLDYFRDPASPLKLLIVTSKLLTGFDAPVLQVMYLDKPMRDHNLLQAICRTNRTYGQGKTHGLIVDYVGVFDHMARFLHFDERGMKRVITNLEEIRAQFPALLKKCLRYFMGVERRAEGWEGLLAAQEALPTSRERDAFAADYRVLNRAWDALSPDPFLKRYRRDYRWLSRVYDSVKPVDGRGRLLWDSLGPKTMALIHAHIRVEGVHDVMETIPLDPDRLSAVLDGQKKVERSAREAELRLSAAILHGRRTPKLVSLGDRMERLREKYERGLLTSIQFLELLLELEKEASDPDRPTLEGERGGRRAALTGILNGVLGGPAETAHIVEEIERAVQDTRFDGWRDTPAGRKDIRRALRSVVWVKFGCREKELFDRIYRCVELYG